MQKNFKLLLIFFLASAGILFAIIAVYGAISAEEPIIPGDNRLSQCIYGIGLSFCCWLGIKKLYDEGYW